MNHNATLRDANTNSQGFADSLKISTTGLLHVKFWDFCIRGLEQISKYFGHKNENIHCGVVETQDHILIYCIFARNIWCGVLQKLDILWSFPNSFGDFMVQWVNIIPKGPNIRVFQHKDSSKETIIFNCFSNNGKGEEDLPIVVGVDGVLPERGVGGNGVVEDGDGGIGVDVGGIEGSEGGREDESVGKDGGDGVAVGGSDGVAGVEGGGAAGVGGVEGGGREFHDHGASFLNIKSSTYASCDEKGWETVVFLAIGFFMRYYKPRKRPVVRKKNKVMMETPMMASLVERREKKMIEAIQEISKLEKLTTRLSFSLLYDATDRFCQENIIQVGKRGTMFKGELPCGSFIAAKRLNGSHYLDTIFISKLIILSQLKHNIMVPFLGFCIESRDRFVMCYKFMQNGKLYDWLHPENGGSSCLDWPTRVFIAKKVAKGLAYLHSNSAYPTAHVNISSSSILLDNDFEPKISNFGGAVFISKNSKNSYQNVFKKDVYRFGVLLLEIVTGEDPVRNRTSFNSLKEHITGEDLVRNRKSSVVDKSVIGERFEHEMLHFLEVACDCLQTLPDQRPTMIEVYHKLVAGSQVDVDSYLSKCG
ncbi:probably inactive leucine-rich repeat receptor-like protein kinase At5g48380 [Mercurialis annua]|uniref:probably inactive leucine-rich repeat receptor-like protein kinase At5g48380 n=1 Tax=Mercurialis annua TaxID=3986 RepID=UPI0024AD7F8E|nr:probably inactive leucine-rich repeat receptor-like protein kinase At5g48380 [Mercurialis annua]